MDSGHPGETHIGPDTDRVLRDVQHQAAATREILEALGRAGGDPSGVLDTIIDRAVHLGRAQVAQLYLLDGDTFRLSRISGDAPEEFIRYVEDHPVGRSRESLLGRVAEDRTTHRPMSVMAAGAAAEVAAPWPAAAGGTMPPAPGRCRRGSSGSSNRPCCSS